MNPADVLDRTIDFLMERFGTRSPNYVPPSRPVPQPSMKDIPFGPYQPLINEAERVKDLLNKQTAEKERIIREQLGR
jgi:hypothetical protein